MGCGGNFLCGCMKNGGWGWGLGDISMMCDKGGGVLNLGKYAHLIDGPSILEICFNSR